MFFYELHEGDQEVFSDVLVVSESEWEPEEFFELVQQIRRRVVDNHGHDTLIEAIAVELERDHGFIFVSDDQLTAAVNVSSVDEENFLTDLEVDLADRAEDEDDDDDDDDEEAAEADELDEDDDDDDDSKDLDYRGVIVDFDPGGRLN